MEYSVLDLLSPSVITLFLRVNTICLTRVCFAIAQVMMQGPGCTEAKARDCLSDLRDKKKRIHFVVVFCRFARTSGVLYKGEN